MGRVQRRKRMNRRRNIRRSRRQRSNFIVNECFVTNVPMGAISTVSAAVFSNVPKFSIWRPVTVRVQASMSPTDTFPAIQVILYNSGGEKVSSSAVQLLSATKTFIWCHYPRTAEWFSPIKDDAKATFMDLRVLCTGVKSEARIGLIITIGVEVKNEIPAVTCPTELASRPLTEDAIVELQSKVIEHSFVQLAVTSP